MPKYIIVPCGVNKDAEGNLPNGDVCSRAVYFTDENGFPRGLPIMFLRDYGMEKAAENLVNAANITGSSNGRTSAFEAVNHGSSPCPVTKCPK